MSGYIESSSYWESARQRGINFTLEPDSRVVVTGFAAVSPFGNTKETWNAIKEGRSAVTTIETGNQHTRLAAPLPSDYDPFSFLSHDDQKRISKLSAISTVVAREAGGMAGLLDEAGNLKEEFKLPLRRKIATWVASGIAETPLIIDIYNALHKKNKDGIEDLGANSRKLDVKTALGVFPEEMNGDTARLLKACGGWGGNDVEACATGAINIVEGARLIKEGRAKVVFCGGFEDALYNHPEVLHGIFASGLRVLATLSEQNNNNDPSKASRPFDERRNGFVPGAGGGIVVVESERFAKARKTKVYAEVLGFAKSIDGSDKTNLDPEVIADTIAEGLWDSSCGGLYKPGAIFAHATSTQPGDILESIALRKVFGKDLRDIPITALKSYLGHLFGGSGSINIVGAVLALNEGYLPRILNLDNPDPKILAEGPMDFVRGTSRSGNINSVLAVSYGFGGSGASVLLGRYIP